MEKGRNFRQRSVIFSGQKCLLSHHQKKLVPVLFVPLVKRLHLRCNRFTIPLYYPITVAKRSSCITRRLHIPYTPNEAKVILCFTEMVFLSSAKECEGREQKDIVSSAKRTVILALYDFCYRCGDTGGAHLAVHFSLPFAQRSI